MLLVLFLIHMLTFKPETLQVRWQFRTISSEKIVLDRDVSGKSEYDQCVGAALCNQSDNILMKENKKKNIFVQCDQILSEWAFIFSCVVWHDIYSFSVKSKSILYRKKNLTFILFNFLGRTVQCKKKKNLGHKNSIL